jgi:alkaline phosphatase D
MAAEDHDLVVHLGDYIYEGAASTAANRPRRHTGPEVETLDGYRVRYALYRSDLDLQAAHAAFPWIVTWDDHEVDNNYANDVSEHAGVPPAAFLARRAAAYRAYYEHMPLRRTSLPTGPSLQLYRRFRWGQLASFFVLDTRQYRTDQPCDDRLSPTCEAAMRPEATLLGRAQADWLFDGLDRSTSRWNIIPQQVMLAKVDQYPGEDRRYYPDQWPGYEAERQRLMDFLARRRPSNPVVLTGDIHSNWVNDLKADYLDERAPIVGTELVGTSISSGGDGSDVRGNTADVLRENPFVRFYNSQRGYVSCVVMPGTFDARYRVVPFVARPDAPIATRAHFVIADGRPGVQR